MLLTPEKLKDINYLSIKTFEKFFFKGDRLKLNNTSKSRLTIGYVSNFNNIDQMEVKKLHDNSAIEYIDNQQNCFFIYSEKFYLLKDLDIIYPDMQKIYAILNFYYSKLFYYNIIDTVEEFKVNSDFYTHIVAPNFYVRNNFKKRVDSSIPNNSHISLFPTTNNEVMMGLTIRLPISKKNSLAISAIPQQDESYKYYLKNINTRSRGGYFEISGLDEAADYIENVLFKNAYFYTAFKKNFNVIEKEDFHQDYFKLYEMLSV